ncbi:uncharacterized protein LOC131669395 [Phymastichus coffea]|uniref:uncharacterized protein LOC131669395 n=1 Tax=Phymastichus coffea TaxID=108790 RepID=UPI00273B4676|nr:uncharacterized protein LOC131669395 [Phymastichus coffea]
MRKRKVYKCSRLCIRFKRLQVQTHPARAVPAWYYYFFLVFYFPLMHKMMMMEPEEPLLQGLLLLPPQGMLGQLKKTWHKKFCQIFRASNYGIQRLEIYDNQDEAASQQHTQRIITLEACVKIAPSAQTNVFTLVTKTGVYHFGCLSESDMANWIGAFQLVAFKDDTSCMTVEEDNDLYCTSGEGIFTVRIAETEASKKCGLELWKNYTLIVGATEMKLMDNHKMLYTWPYQYIRKYGYRDGKFTFEAGRRCGSGEGAFCLEHKNQLEIYRCFTSNKKKMKQMLNGEHSPTIENNDAQFQAALSMEAGSRSPLPPSSINLSKNLIDLEIPSFCQNSQKPLLSPVSPTEPVKPPKPLLSPVSPTEPVKPPLPAKPKPLKPPRKPVFTSKLDKKSFDSEISDPSASGKYRKLSSPTSPDPPKKNIVVTDDEKHSYDLVEVRSDAWKTHGMETVPHTERMKASKQVKSDKDGNEDSHYETMSFPLSATNSVKSNTSSIIHNIPSPNDPPDYDRLQHFGSIHKNKNKSGYRTPNCSTISSQSSQLMTQSSIEANPNSNNYDVVEDMNAVRLADDSHHGYGIIRKKSNSSANMMEPKHKIVNDTEYAIVSKPKRV